MEKPELYWITDGFGTPSCHVNDGGLNMQESMVGKLKMRGDAWRVFSKDNTDITPPEGCPSLARARMALEAYARRTVLKSRRSS